MHLMNQVHKERKRELLKKVYLIEVFVSLFLATYTFVILNLKPSPQELCPTNLKWCLYVLMFMHATNFIQYICELTGQRKEFCHNNIMDKMFDLYEVLSLVLLSSVLYFSDICFDIYYVCILVNMIGYAVYFTATIILRIKARMSRPTIEQIERKMEESHERRHEY